MYKTFKYLRLLWRYQIATSLKKVVKNPMSLAGLQTKVIYGLKTNIEGNAHFLTDNDVLYPIGNVLAVHNFSQCRQRLLYLPENRQINIICVAPTKKFVAICETGEKPLISIYELSSLKRKRTLGIPYEVSGVTKFSCIAFSFDTRYLAAITGEPDQTMLYYVWEKGKVESSIRLTNPQNSLSSFFLISCNPGDIGIVAVAGDYAFKFLTVSETVWRSYGFGKADNLLISSICWLNTDRLLAGIKDGRIFYFENGELKNIYKMEQTTLLNLKVKEEFVLQPTSSQTNLAAEVQWPNEIRCLIAFPKGFAFAFGLGKVLVFEKQGQHKYLKKHIFTIPSQVSQESQPDSYKINFITINPSFDQLLVTSNWAQLFYAKLFNEENLETKEFSIMGQQLHHGRIGRISMCAWKSVFMTYGCVDRSVRLWDYETESLLLMKQYAEDIFSVSLHPIGLFCLIGFSDKLKFLTILMDDLLLTAEFSIRSCRTVDFSHGGHLFAAVNGNVIQIYFTIGFSNRLLLKGHTGKIKELKWAQNDLKLVSIGSEGAIYIWNTGDGSRMSEIILKNVSIHGVAFSAQESVIYCISSDNKIREIKEDTVLHEFNAPDVVMSLLLMSQQDSFLFITCPGGKICSFKVPLHEPLEFQTFHLHSEDITDLSVTFNQQIIVSSGKDGSLAFWKLLSGNNIDSIKSINTQEVLISKKELENKIKNIDELNLRLKELETEHSYKVRQIEVQNNEKMKDIHQGYCAAIEELKDRIEQLKEERMNELNNINQEIAEMKAFHERTVQEMESSYNAKLIVEYDKYVELEKSSYSMKEDYEEQIKKLQVELKEELRKTVEGFEVRIHAKNVEIEELQEEMTHLVREYEKIKEDMEEDFDREVIELRTNYENQLYKERQDNLKLKGEAGMMRNRYSAAQKDIDDLKRQVMNLKKDHTRYQKNVQVLERDVIDLKNEIDERNAMIQEKDKKVGELENKNQELEKIKFVLNYRIEELKNEIEPRNEEIVELKNKIHDMEMELINLHKVNTSLEVRVNELRDKLVGIKRKLSIEVEKERKAQMMIKKIRHDLAETVEVFQDPKALKIVVKNLYQRYGIDDQFLKSQESDVNVYLEFSRQRDQMERTIATLKKRVFRKK